MATTADAELILRLYELRREELLRKARRFLVFEFNPKTVEELRVVSRDTKSELNPYLAAGHELLGDGRLLRAPRSPSTPDLFLDSNVEGNSHLRQIPPLPR